MKKKRDEHDTFDRTFVGSPLVMIIFVYCNEHCNKLS